MKKHLQDIAEEVKNDPGFFILYGIVLGTIGFFGAWILGGVQ